jgi:hypothetical protein
MEYMITVQLGGLLIYATCFSTRMYAVRDSPMEIRILDHKGKVMSTVEGAVDCSGNFYV